VPTLPDTNGRRQARKLKVAEAAVRLFEKRGLTGTTVEMIAAEAGISPRTFFRYFDTKESAAFPDHADRVVELERRLDARLPSRAPLSDVIELSKRSAMEFFDNPDLYHRRYRLLRSNEVLHDLERVFDRRYEERLVAFLMACDIERVTACACAGAVVAVVNAALDVWAESPRTDPTPAQATLDSGLQMVLTAFSNVALASAPLTVFIAADDPLRGELLAAVQRGATVSQRS
jgi:AcrR family transcriptional regulator